jgi:hypothetical protein
MLITDTCCRSFTVFRVEWLSCVPLMCFTMVSLHRKNTMPKEDKTFVLSLWFCIVFGFAMVFTKNVAIGSFFCILSTLCCCGTTVVMVQQQFIPPLDILSKSHYLDLLENKRKKTLAEYIGVVFWIFPILYFAKMLDWIDNDLLSAGLVLGSCFTKVIFASLCMDAHLHVSHPSIAAFGAEKSKHCSRLCSCYHNMFVCNKTVL